MKLWVSYLLFILSILVISTGWGAPSGYNELMDEDGNVRAHYQQVYSIYSKIKSKAKKEIAEKTTNDFMGDNALFPIPRLFTKEEYKLIQEGVEQRGNALRLFLRDHYSGDKEYLKQKVIPEKIIQNIIKRTGEQSFEGLIRPQDISFWYGPDIIRGPDGKFKVLEDNLGFIGGMGDLKLASESLLERVPEYKSVLKKPNSAQFYKNLIARYRERMDNPEDAIVLVNYPESYYADNEDYRVTNLFNDQNVKIYNLPETNSEMKPSKLTNELGIDKHTIQDIKVVSDGVFYIDSDSNQRVKIGLLIFNLDSHVIDPNHEKSYALKIISEAYEHLDEGLYHAQRKRINAFLDKEDYVTLEKYLRAKSPYEISYNTQQGVRGALDAVAAGKVKAVNLPGTGFVEDKEFYLYVEDIIRYYLDEEPIIRNIETQSFAILNKQGVFELNQTLFKSVFKAIKKNVIKKVNGRGGEGVTIGAKATKSQIELAKKEIACTPSLFIKQKYTPPSNLGEYIIDNRAISDVGPNSVYVAPIPWGRGVIRKGGDGKVNISASGSETVSFIVNDCGKVLTKL